MSAHEQQRSFLWGKKTCRCRVLIIDLKLSSRKSEKCLNFVTTFSNNYQPCLIFFCVCSTFFLRYLWCKWVKHNIAVMLGYNHVVIIVVRSKWLRNGHSWHTKCGCANKLLATVTTMERGSFGSPPPHRPPLSEVVQTDLEQANHNSSAQLLPDSFSTLWLVIVNFRQLAFIQHITRLGQDQFQVLITSLVKWWRTIEPIYRK